MHKHHQKRSTAARSGPNGSKSPTPSITAPSGNKDSDARAISAEDIRLYAYLKWESAGKPNDDGLQFWLAAEQELAHGK
ncbi:MAG: DUF2934 domain-containing protein [Planctomycetes bacterium]|nr:DUF2934 domain-containing protein [Planctomycetota bacterium]